MSELKVPVSESDHVQGGDENSPITLVEYGDYQCSVCGRAYSAIKAAQAALKGDLRFVYRNFPLATLHEHAENAAEAAEIASASDKFWEMHDLLFEHQSALSDDNLVLYAKSIGLNTEEFADRLSDHSSASRVREDFVGGARSGVNGTPTFFINGVRYDGRWEHGALLRELREVIYTAR